MTGIAGGFRYVNASCFGVYAHSGAEPRFARRDSVVGFADLVAGLDSEWDALEREGLEATITFGRVESDPTQHGGSRVLGEIGFTLDVRSADVVVVTVAAEVDTSWLYLAVPVRVSGSAMVVTAPPTVCAVSRLSSEPMGSQPCRARSFRVRS